MAPAEVLRIEVVYCAGPGQIDQTSLTLPLGSTVTQAVQASGLLARHALPAERMDVGVWFRPAAPDTVLRDRDRVEVYRPLQVDPKEARRLRYRRRTPISRSPS